MTLNKLTSFILAIISGLGLSVMSANSALAQEWPVKTIRWIVPFPPGGAMDVIARSLAEKSSKTLGQPIVIENKPGAGGNIGAALVARSDADGYTMLSTSIGMATNKYLCPKFPQVNCVQSASQPLDDRNLCLVYLRLLNPACLGMTSPHGLQYL